MTREESRGEQALVLRVGTFREIDCWVRFFSPVRGIETAFAFGGRRSRRRFPGCLDALSHLRIDLERPRSGRYLTLCQGTLLHRFSGLHQHVQRLGMAVNCIKFLEAAHNGSGQAESIFDLTLHALHVLSVTSDVPATFPLVFRVKLTCMYGYEPVLDVCGNCGEKLSDLHKGSFSWAGGRALCPRCRNRDQGSALIHDLDLARLGQILQGSPEDWICSAWPRSGEKKLWQALDSFVQFHTGLQWEKGRFRRV